MHVCDKQAGICPGPCGLCVVSKKQIWLFLSPFTSNFMFEQVSCGVSMKTLKSLSASPRRDAHYRRAHRPRRRTCGMPVSRSQLFSVTILLTGIASLSILAYHHSLDLRREDAAKKVRRHLHTKRARQALKAHRQMQQRTSGSDRGCPAVYIYDPPPASKDLLDLPTISRDAFGPRLPGTLQTGESYLYDSQQHGLGSIILTRLLGSNGRCRRVQDPRQAELFIVPITFPPLRANRQDESEHVYDFMPPSALEQLWSVCSRFVQPRGPSSNRGAAEGSGLDWLAALPHLSDTTARRHVMIPLMYHFELHAFCMGADPGWELALERNRTVAALLARMPDLWQGPLGVPRMRNRGVRGLYGRQHGFTAPLVSSVHLRHSGAAAAAPSSANAPASLPRPPWAVRPPSERPWLMSYGGSLEGSPRASALRKLLADKCRAWGNQVRRARAHAPQAPIGLRCDSLGSESDAPPCATVWLTRACVYLTRTCPFSARLIVAAAAAAAPDLPTCDPAHDGGG